MMHVVKCVPLRVLCVPPEQIVYLPRGSVMVVAAVYTSQHGERPHGWPTHFHVHPIAFPEKIYLVPVEYLLPIVEANADNVICPLLDDFMKKYYPNAN